MISCKHVGNVAKILDTSTCDYATLDFAGRMTEVLDAKLNTAGRITNVRLVYAPSHVCLHA